MVLHTVGYKDEGSGALTGSGKYRPIAYRMSFCGESFAIIISSEAESRRDNNMVGFLLQRWWCPTGTRGSPTSGRMRLMQEKTG